MAVRGDDGLYNLPDLGQEVGIIENLNYYDTVSEAGMTTRTLVALPGSTGTQLGL